MNHATIAWFSLYKKGLPGWAALFCIKKIPPQRKAPPLRPRRGYILGAYESAVRTVHCRALAQIWPAVTARRYARVRFYRAGLQPRPLPACKLGAVLSCIHTALLVQVLPLDGLEPSTSHPAKAGALPAGLQRHIPKYPRQFPAGDAQRGKEDMGDHALT